MKKLTFAILVLLVGASQNTLACGGGGGGYCRGGRISTGEGTLNFKELVNLTPLAVLDAQNVMVRAQFIDGTSSIFQINQEELDQVDPRIAERFMKAYDDLINSPSI